MLSRETQTTDVARLPRHLHSAMLDDANDDSELAAWHHCHLTTYHSAMLAAAQTWHDCHVTSTQQHIDNTNDDSEVARLPPHYHSAMLDAARQTWHDRHVTSTQQCWTTRTTRWHDQCVTTATSLRLIYVLRQQNDLELGWPRRCHGIIWV
jgi:hypothetical protein